MREGWLLERWWVARDHPVRMLCVSVPAWAGKGLKVQVVVAKRCVRAEQETGRRPGRVMIENH